MANDKPSPEINSSKTSPAFPTNVTDMGINALVKITLAAFEEAPSWLKGLGLAIALSSIAVIVYGFGFFWTDEPFFALVSLLSSMGLIAFVVVIMKQTLAHTTLFPGGKKKFTHAVSKVTEAKTLVPLGNDIEDIRLACLEIFRQLHPELEVENNSIRGNVFMPDYRSVGSYGCVFQLYMPAELRREMNNEKENRIVLLPGEGVSGTVFIEGGQKIIPQEQFPLRDSYKLDLHPDLKWVISTPIKSLDDKTVLAVLNIDVLKYELQEEDFHALGDLIKERIRKLEEDFDKFEKVVVHILEEEFNKIP